MDNVLAITFADDQNAFAGLTALKELDDQGQLGLTGAAVVMRNEDGSIDIKDEVGDVGYAGTATGGIVGLLVGILGGPLGILIGGATGRPHRLPVRPRRHRRQRVGAQRDVPLGAR
jgi:uncharacterized membrane protein